MKLELGHKIKRTREDDDTSSVHELWMANDRAGPVFLSRETHSMFILIAHLEGYTRNSIEIKIKEDDREISTSEEKLNQEVVIMGRVMHKNQEEVLGFKKVFKIPNGVVLDQIRAKYNEEDPVLKIFMPKLVKGICGIQIEEVKEEKFGESSHKASKEFEVQLTEDPRLEISNGHGESVREEDGKEEIEAMKNLELGQNVEDHVAKNIEDKSQEVSKNIAIQSLEESVVLARKIREEIIGGKKEKEIEDPNLEIEDRKKERVEEDISKEGLGAWETTMKGGKSRYVLERKIWVSGEDMVEGTKLKEIEEPKYETKDRDIQVKEESKKGLEVMETVMKEFQQQAPKQPLQLKKSRSFVERVEGEEFEKFLASAIGDKGDNIKGGSKEIEIEELEFEIEDSDKGSVEEEITKEGFEAMKTKVKELAQAPKEPLQIEDIDSVIEIIKEGEEIIGGAKRKEIEEPMFEHLKGDTVKEGSQAMETIEREFPQIVLIKTPFKETEDGKEVMTKRESQEVEGFIEEEEGKEPNKMNEEPRKVIEKDNTNSVEQKGTEELSIRIFEDGQNVQESLALEYLEMDKIHEGCKILEATLEREKCKTTQNVKHEKPRTKKEVTQVVESMQMIPKKEHPKQLKEVESEGEHLEAKVAHLEVTRMEIEEVEPKDETKKLHLKESPPPQIEMQSKELLELEKESKKWKFTKTQKHVLEAIEKRKAFKVMKNEEKGKTYECHENGCQKSQVPKKHDSELDPQFVRNNHELIGQRESHGGYEIKEEEANEQGDEVQMEISQAVDELKDIQVEGCEKEKADEQGDEVQMEISREIKELKDIQVEASEKDKASEQGDEVYVEISQKLEERKDSKLEGKGKKKLHAPLVIAGSAFLVSLIVFFVHHKRVRKR